MDRAFWESRWETGQIGFHLSEVNPHLARHHAVLPVGGRILVPLCGKTLDLPWLAAQGHQVVGVERVERAILEFFEGHGLSYTATAQGDVTVYRAGAITLLQGDLFALTPEAVGPIDGLWDRAALIAMPAELRARYVHALGVLAPSAVGLLVTLQHDLASGPPFSVDDAEVRAHFGTARVRLLDTHDITAQSANLLAKGARQVLERVYALD